MYRKYEKLGRPTGPTENREERPWDPSGLKPIQISALMYVAANPNAYRWEIAQAIGMSGSRLSILTCSEIGKEFLNQFDGPNDSRLLTYKL